jgi:iduronate 2-sulfatase
LTGLRPDTLGVWDLPTHFRQKRPDVITLPQLFKQNGYHAQNIGKIFHNGRQDAYKGDAVSWSEPAVMHYASHGDDKAQVDGPLPPNLSRVPKTEMRDVPDEAYFDGRIARLAVEALNRLKDRPFFLAVGFWKPHAQYNAPKRYWDLYQRSQIPPVENPTAPSDVPEIAMHDSREVRRAFADRPGGRPTTAEAQALRHGYYAAISYVDAQVGKVLDELDRLGLRDKTIVVFWSDHGYHLGEQSLWAKTSNFELDARVPLIIATPGRPGGQRTNSIVELVDLYPALADLCGLAAPADLEGVSLRPVLDNPLATVKEFAITQHTRPAYPSDEEPIAVMGYSMRTDRYRYAEWRAVADGRVLARELYDHHDDPREMTNIAARADQEELIAQLSAQLATAIKRRSAP